MAGLEPIPFSTRLHQAVAMAWDVFGHKAGGGLLPLNKEASMQLQFAYLLQQLLPLQVYSADEHVELELETAVKTASGHHNIDVLLRARSPAGPCRIAMELKCYRNETATGGTRGAHDIWMKDVYEDLQVLEEYLEAGVADYAIGLVMTDLARFVHPKRKDGACWAYDTSEGTTYPGGLITVRIGGKSRAHVDVRLARSYTFRWQQRGKLWFTWLEGVPPAP